MSSQALKRSRWTSEPIDEQIMRSHVLIVSILWEVESNVMRSYFDDSGCRRSSQLIDSEAKDVVSIDEISW